MYYVKPLGNSKGGGRRTPPFYFEKRKESRRDVPTEAFIAMQPDISTPIIKPFSLSRAS